MTDILERLRSLQEQAEGDKPFGYVKDIFKCAADEIERLKEQLAIAEGNGVRAQSYFETCERLRAALLKKSKCVALHMGGNHCVGKCLDPKDCSETAIPNEQLATGEKP